MLLTQLDPPVRELVGLVPASRRDVARTEQGGRRDRGREGPARPRVVEDPAQGLAALHDAVEGEAERRDARDADRIGLRTEPADLLVQRRRRLAGHPSRVGEHGRPEVQARRPAHPGVARGFADRRPQVRTPGPRRHVDERMQPLHRRRVGAVDVALPDEGRDEEPVGIPDLALAVEQAVRLRDRRVRAIRGPGPPAGRRPAGAARTTGHLCRARRRRRRRPGAGRGTVGRDRGSPPWSAGTPLPRRRPAAGRATPSAAPGGPAARRGRPPRRRDAGDAAPAGRRDGGRARDAPPGARPASRAGARSSAPAGAGNGRSPRTRPRPPARRVPRAPGDRRRAGTR